ncbi:MAG: MFS transporter [Planctomycetota bacterium]|jgi:ACS family glucarate transporter-like MFS transporter
MIPRRYLLILGTFLLSVLLYVDRVCISTAKKSISEDFGLDKDEFGVAMSAFALGYALCQTPSGWLADRLGPRRVLTVVVSLWSLFTGLTAAAWNYVSLLVTRFFFGGAEAGAFPGIARATYSWIPMQERGLVQGINFSGSRLGAAAAMPAVAAMIVALGWRLSFAVLMVVGFGAAAAWYYWFRDDPVDHPRIGRGELEHILATRQQADASGDSGPPLTAGLLLRSRNVWLASIQYFCSNFTFFICLTWQFPHLEEKFELTPVAAGWYSSMALVAGALGNWLSGWLVDRIYRSGRWTLSRRLTAMLGFCLAAIGLTACAQMSTPLGWCLWFSLAIFGADMTLAPSWSLCIDVGRRHAGVVSGTMNMAGNLGSFFTALAFPFLEKWTGRDEPFFYTAAALSLLAVALWMLIRPNRTLEDY